MFLLAWEFFFHTHAMAAADPTAKGSWWAGMEMEGTPKITPHDSNAPNFEDGPPLLQIPCGVIITRRGDNAGESDASQVLPLKTILDTSRAFSQISLQVIKTNGLSNLVVWDDEIGRAYIPAKSLWLRLGSLEATIHAPAILVVKEQEEEFDFHLGVDFLRQNGGIIDLREDELYIMINGESVMIPFIRPRAPLSFGEDL